MLYYEKVKKGGNSHGVTYNNNFYYRGKGKRTFTLMNYSRNTVTNIKHGIIELPESALIWDSEYPTGLNVGIKMHELVGY